MSAFTQATAIAPPDGLRRNRPAGQRLGLSKSHIPSRKKVSVIELFKGASYLSVRSRWNTSSQNQPPKRGEIHGFSSASQRRMLDLMAKIEVAQVPVFVTLTYPNEFPVYSHEFKRHLEIFCQRLQRRWPEAVVIWKLEFKERKSGENKGKVAPHYHLFIYNVAWEFPYRVEKRKGFQIGREDCHLSCVRWSGDIFANGNRVDFFERKGIAGGETEPLDDLKQWISRNWYDVVSSNDVRHFRAGTRVERLRTVKGAFAYAAKKYMVKAEAMPELKCKPGRFWGVINRKCLKLGERQRIEVTAEQAMQLRRIIRRYRRANTKPEKRRWLRKGDLCGGQEFSVKLYCSADYWLERLPKLIGNFLCNFFQTALLHQQADNKLLNAAGQLKFQSDTTKETRQTLPEAETALSDLSSPPNHYHHSPCITTRVYRALQRENYSTNHV